jgi:hypothetical protein
MKKYISIVFFFIAHYSNAQDTIYTVEGKIIFSKIIEIQSETIRYKLFTFQDGPDYLLEKNKIAAIHYAQGLKETFQLDDKTEVVKNRKKQPTNDYYTPQINLQNQPIVHLGNRYMINGIPASENQFYIKALSIGDSKIAQEIKYAKKARGLQYIGFAAIPLGYIGLLGIVSGLDGSTNNNNNNNNNNSNNNNSSNSNYNQQANIVLGTIGIIGAIVSTGISVYYKTERKAANERILRIYNQRF